MLLFSCLLVKDAMDMKFKSEAGPTPSPGSWMGRIHTTFVKDHLCTRYISKQYMEIKMAQPCQLLAFLACYHSVRNLYEESP